MNRCTRNHASVATLFMFAVALVLGCADAPTWPDSAGDRNEAQLARGGKGEGPATYEYTFSGDIESDAFLATASSKDPFGVETDNATLRFPDVQLPTECEGGGSLVFEPDWGGYPGSSWTSSMDPWGPGLSFSGPRGKKQTGGGVSALMISGEDGWINLQVQVRNGPAVKSTYGETSTLTFTNDVALVGSGSQPPDGPEDAGDRCVTFTITAVRQ